MKTKKATAQRAAPKKRAAAKPPAPKHWTPDIHGISVVTYHVRDWARAKKFYGETLGLPVAFEVEQVGWCEFGVEKQPTFAINKWESPDAMPIASGAAVLTCPDVRATIAKLRAKGVRCDDVEEIPGMVILGNVYDPEGNRLQLAQPLVS
ncbi:MAG: VOC family protein [Chloroflexi bacterium]|nr:VOC family protein [Chloroflexota bacterium]